MQLSFGVDVGENVEKFLCNVTSALRPDVTKLAHKNSYVHT